MLATVNPVARAHRGYTVRRARNRVIQPTNFESGAKVGKKSQHAQAKLKKNRNRVKAAWRGMSIEPCATRQKQR